MAKQNRLQSTTIQFNVQGIQEIFGYQKKIKDAMKEIIAQKKKDLEQSGLIGAAYEKELELIKQMEKEVKRYGSTADNLQKVLENVGAASAKQLQQAEKALKNIRDGIKFDGKKMGVADAEEEVGILNNTIQKVHKQFEAIQAEAHNATGFKVMGKSVQQLNEFVTNFERNAQYLTSQMQNGKQVFAEWGAKATEAKVRLGQLDGSLLAVNKSSNAETLRAYIKGWQEVAQYSGASSEQIKRANENIAKADALMRELMQKRIDNAGKTNLAGREYYSPAQVREAVEYMKQLSTSEKLTTEEREKLNASIKRGDEYLKQLTLDQQRYSMTLQLGGKQMSNIKTLSDASLASQKKYWTEMVANTERGTAEYKQYLATLKAVTDEEQRRDAKKLKEEGVALVGDVYTGAFSGTIKETEEAIQKIQAYKKELNTETEQSAIVDADEALKKLNETLVQTNTEVVNGKNAFNNLYSIADEGVDAVIAKLPRGSEELKKMRSDLEAYKKSLKDPDPSRLQQIETIFTAIDKKEKEVAASEIEWGKFQGTELKKRSLVELRDAYDRLKKKLETMTIDQKEFNEEAMRMQQIDKQIKNMTRSMGHHTTSLENAASRLKNYVLIYFGFNKALDLTRGVIQNTIELSDQMTNVRKVTGLTTLEIEKMTHALQDLDTRTTNQQLMEMAEQAGKLGIATREGADGIVQFVKAGQEIINTLGDIGGAEAITKLLKVNEVVNKNATSIEIDLGKIGSAILNIGNNSKATYADVVEFTQRLGATGSAANLSLEQIMGLAGAYSSLGESMERSATATQRVLMGIITRTKEVSEALNINYAEMDQLIKSGDTMGAFVMALKALNEQGVGAMEGFFKAIGGRNNQQARAAIALLSQHVNELQYQVALAKEGFDDGTLVTQEFEKANNNLAGVMAKVQNELYEMTTAIEGSNGVLLDAAKALLDFVKWLRTSSGASSVFAGAIAYAVAQVALFIVQLPKVTVLLKALWAQIVLSGQGVKNMTILLFNAIPAFFGVKSAADRATASLNALKAAGMTNWITALITALGMLIGYLYQLKVASRDAAKEMGEVRQKADEEMYALERLVSTLRRVWDNQKERQKGINEFNRKFGEYYGHLLQETASLNDLAIAYKAVAKNALEAYANELKANAAGRGMQASREEREEVSEEISGAMTGKNINMGKGLSDTEREQLQSELEQTVLNYWADESIKNKSIEGSMTYLQNKYANDRRLFSAFGSRGNVNLLTGYNLAGEYKANAGLKGFSLYGKLKSYSEATAKGYKVQQRDIREAERYEAMGAEKGRQQADRIYQQLTNPDRKLSDQEIYDLGNQYISLMAQYGTKQTGGKAQMQQSLKEGMWDWSGGNKNKWTSFQVPGAKQQNKKDNWLAPSSGYDRTEDVRLRVAQAAQTVHPWGKTAFNWSEQYGGDLANVIKFFDELEKGAKAGQKFSLTSAYASNVPVGVTIPQDIDSWTKEQVHDWAYKNWLDAVNLQKQLNNDNGGGNFVKDKSGGTSKIKTEMKDEMDATLKKLEEYYERRNMLAEKYLNEGQISEEEYNRYMFANEQEHLMERQNLRRKWLDGDQEFMTQGVKDLMNGVDFAKLSAFLKGMGEDMVDGIKLNIAKDENEVEKNIRASREKVMKVLLDERPIAKVAETFTKDLADLGVLFGDANEALLHTGEDTQQMMIDRMSFLMDEAKKGYALTAQQMIEDAKNYPNPLVATWLEGLNPDALSALVLKTQGFYDEYEDAVRKMVKKMEKRIEFERNQVGEDGMSQNQRWEESKNRLSRRQKTQGVAESWGMTGNDIAGVLSSERTQVDLLQKELEIKREQYELDKKRYAEELKAIQMRIYAEGDPKERAALMQEAEAIKTAALMAEQEAWKGIQDAQREATEAQFELMSKSVEQIKPYYDNLNSFAEDFGANIFGSKADREQASRELLSNVIKTTGQLLTQWLVYISTKKMFDKMEILNEEVKQKQLLVIKLNAQAAEMTALGQQAQAEEAVKQAQNLTDAASAQAKEAAKAGWVGWAIGAGLSLLMTMVFSALSAKAKSAISSATGVSNGAGKLATGMLTYGKGRYPVYADGVFANDGNGRVQGQMVSVKGNDGVNYMAKYQPNLQTGVVNGPHLGIVGEKGAELIVDHGTYEGLKRYDPETLRRIYAMKQYGMRSIDFSRTSRMGNEVLMNRGGVRAYADGNINEKLGDMRMDENGGNDAGTVTQMQQTLAELTMVLGAIKATGIPATVSYLGANGAQKQMEKGDKFLQRVGLKKS